ncbi:barstar family protein [Nocardia blacklockiae]|uniref:barstar family protein n=1 Tax=Nocardia blacklockiae TaxID=480036 RepID=UPI001895CFC6|nr:barstar family protein [Nocardia blacklockiae]MBF6172538.1 barstar family protein [Nocardia blacklockiae]
MTSPMTLAQFLSGPAGEATSGADAPVLGSLPVDDREFSGVRYRVPDDYRVRELRGTRMTTTAGVFDEFAAAFQFPYYFGENKDAFDESLRDLDDFVGRGRGYVVVVRDADRLLADQPEQRKWFAEAMRDAAAYWSVRDTVFRVVLQGAAVDAVPLTL